MSPASTQDLSLTIERTYQATPDAVFDAWTKPAILAKWFNPAPGGTATVHEHRLAKGGRYRLTMHMPDGEAYTIAGVFQEVDRPRRLAMTWKWEGEDADPAESLVTVALRPTKDGTSLTLTHERLGSKESVASHTEGWEGCLARLAAEGL